MRISAIILVLSFAACLGPGLDAQDFEIASMQNLKNTETFHAAHLSIEQTKEILEQVERTSFDVPDSWESELRVRRKQIGEGEGLIVQATKSLCGGTGNCQTWVFRRSAGKWVSMFENQAPIISGFTFTKTQSNGINGFIGVGHASAEVSNYVVFTFDGKFYRLTNCYQRDGDDAAQKVPCN